MSIHRSQSMRNGQEVRGPQRPFSTNNPFRNASYDSNIGVNSNNNNNNNTNNAGFHNWVQRNRSQMSFSSDDEEGELFRAPQPVRPQPGRTRSDQSGNSMKMAPRRASNNPFSEPNSAQSTGSQNMNNSPPVYPSNTTTDYYSSANEKSRPPPQQQQEAPPSYEEAAGPRKAKQDYPREKSEHRTRVDREWTGDANGSSNSAAAAYRSRSQSHKQSSRSHHRSEKERGSDRTHRSKSHHHHSSSKESSSRHRRSSSTKKEDKPPAKNVDTIDKLDVTGLFGGAFHHDGPFDACTPHRNKNQKSAPVLAFPADGPNSTIRGGAPVSKDAKLKYIQGREDDEDELYTTSVSSTNYNRANTQLPGNGSSNTLAAVKNTESIHHFDTNNNANPVNGETTLGLGSSTFLDGAPAAKTAQDENNKSQLGRKKSLRQRFGGNSQSPPSRSATLHANNTHNIDDSARFQDEDQPLKVENGGNSLMKRVKSLKVGRNRS